MVTPEQIAFLRENVNRYSNPEIGKVIGRTPDSVAYLMRKHNIKRSQDAIREITLRGSIEALDKNKEANTGPNNPRWLGGVSKDNMRYRKRQKERWPEKEKCRRIVKQALMAGTLLRGPCEVCGTTERVEAHHNDYSAPLAVQWLCYKHHRDLHNGKLIKKRAA